MNTINEKILRTVNETVLDHHLIRKNDRILIGVSGGPDSMALLDILCGLKKKMPFDLLIGHLNHGIRGKEADGDERFVKRAGERYGIPVVTARIDLPALQKKEKRFSLEEIGHRERIIFFRNILKKRRFSRIALAHHHDDSIENFLMTVLDGGGPNALSGIKPAEGEIIRPLIRCTRPDLLAYVRSRRLPFRTDRTNRENRYTRNWIRNILIPFLEKKHRPVKANITRLMDILYHENEFAGSRLNRIRKAVSYHPHFYSCVLRGTGRTDPALLRRLAREILLTLGLASNFSTIGLVSRFIRSRAASLELDSAFVWRSGKNIFFSKKKHIRPYCFSLNRQTAMRKIKELGLSVGYSVLDAPPETMKENALYLDKGKAGKIIIRNKKKGDYIILLNTDFRTRLKKLLIDLKIPEPLRNMLPVVECKGEVAGIYLGFPELKMKSRISEKFKITGKTRKTVKLEFTQSL